MKKILLTLLLLPGIGFAKSYVVDMKVCDTNTNCMKCHETVQVTYIANEKSKKVTVSGKDVNGKDVSETLDNCKISDTKNWSCESAFITTQVSNGVVKLMNKTNSSLASGKKEVCLIKQ
jgi:hypothetical protein